MGGKQRDKGKLADAEDVETHDGGFGSFGDKCKELGLVWLRKKAIEGIEGIEMMAWIQLIPGKLDLYIHV